MSEENKSQDQNTQSNEFEGLFIQSAGDMTYE